MKKTIYRYFFYEFLRYFTITLFALAVIVWTIQAVNYLDLVSEDGHAFLVYFAYSFLTLSKVVTKIMPFCFLIAMVLTISKLEKDNELMALWTSGLNKIHIVNSGLVSTYGKNIIEAVKRRDQIAVESFKYMQEKTKGLTF